MSRIEKHTYHVTWESFYDFFCYNDDEGSTKAMNEGETYWVIADNGDVVESVWDDVSQEMFNDNTYAYKTLRGAIENHGYLPVYFMNGRIEMSDFALKLVEGA